MVKRKDGKKGSKKGYTIGDIEKLMESGATNSVKEAVSKMVYQGCRLESVVNTNIEELNSIYKARKTIKQALINSDIEWRGVHGFRQTARDYYEKEKIPTMSKEDLVKEILNLMDAQGKNLMVPSKEKVLKGQKVYIKKKIGVDGTPIFEPKYTYGKLQKQKMHTLRKMYIEENLRYLRNNEDDSN